MARLDPKPNCVMLCPWQGSWPSSYWGLRLCPCGTCAQEAGLPQLLMLPPLRPRGLGLLGSPHQLSQHICLPHRPAAAPHSTLRLPRCPHRACERPSACFRRLRRASLNCAETLESDRVQPLASRAGGSQGLPQIQMELGPIPSLSLRLPTHYPPTHSPASSSSANMPRSPPPPASRPLHLLLPSAGTLSQMVLQVSLV